VEKRCPNTNSRLNLGRGERGEQSLVDSASPKRGMYHYVWQMWAAQMPATSNSY